MYHFENESAGDGPNASNNYRRLKTFKITVNENNTLSYETYQDFPLIEGGGTYNEEWDLFDMWYTFQNGNNVMRVEGFLYRDRVNEDLRLLRNWIEAQRLLREPEPEPEP